MQKNLNLLIGATQRAVGGRAADANGMQSRRNSTIATTAIRLNGSVPTTAMALFITAANGASSKAHCSQLQRDHENIVDQI